MTRVMVVDDHALVREGVCRALERAGFSVVGEAGDGEEAVHKAVELVPDVVVMDLSLPVVSGIAATKRIRAEVPSSAVLVLSMLSDEIAVDSALAAGASGFVVKDSTTAEIVAAVQAVAEGRRVLPPLAEPPKQIEPPAYRPLADAHGVMPLITPREEEVLRTMATGLSISEAAKQLYISQKTLKNHLSSIYQKLDSHDRAQAVLKAMRMGLVQVG